MSSKRSQADDEGARPPKRPRAERRAPVLEEINFARQLQQLLTFRQDGVQELRDGIASFKAFLENILYHKEEDSRARQLSILREYLETQKPLDVNSLDRPFLAQLWQAWSFGSQNNDDYLVSSVSSILALLLKTVSSILDFRDQGLLLCRTVIQNQHLRLIKRALDAPKHKEHLISPCLRLLTEATSFDGGALAREVYKRREQTFDISTLRRNLSLIKVDVTDEEARRRPSLRTQTIRYVLQHLKYLHEGGKIDILKNRGLCTALFQNLRDDPSDLVVDLLDTIEQNILKDQELPRSTKAAVLTAQNLERVTEIASRTSQAETSPETSRAFTWLHNVCTNPALGVLRSQGWYPPGSDSLPTLAPDDLLPTQDVPTVTRDGRRAFNVRNTTLLTWLLTLRPHANIRERELFVAALTAAPELVAAYLSEKSIQLEPKLSNTWIGLASVIFEIIRLPIPAYLGHEHSWSTKPPSPAIILENILPSALTQKILTRCLNQSSTMIKFFAIRLLVLAFQKMKVVLQQHEVRSQRDNASIWLANRDALKQLFAERCPTMKEVISAFRQTTSDEKHILQREGITRLLRLYYEVIPLQALDEHFEISASLTTALLQAENQADAAGDASELAELQALELDSLLVIAENSPGIRWFHKGPLQFSPILTLLRIYQKDRSRTEIHDLIIKVLTEHGICSPLDDSEEATSAVYAVLVSVHDLEHDDAAWLFIEDCMTRASQRPVKYVDDMQAIGALLPESTLNEHIPSVLAAVILEQAAFVKDEKKASRSSKEAWTESFLQLLVQTKDQGPILSRITRDISNILNVRIGSESGSYGKVNLKNLTQLERVVQHEESGIASTAKDILPASFQAAAAEPANHPELFRWSQKDIDLAIEDGDIDGLILCLCSKHADIRRQAFTQLIRVRTQLRASTAMENSGQLSLVLGELSETFEQQYFSSEKPLPYLTGCFAVRAFSAQRNPASDIYPKLNRFLIRGPEWRSSRLPAYWLQNTVLAMPEDDDAYWREIRWVLEWLVDGLRTLDDYEILRRGGVFEKVMALTRSPGAATHSFIRENVLQLIYRATLVEGGALSLVTRAGVLSWLDLIQNDSGDSDIIGSLRQHVVRACDPDRLKGWVERRKTSVTETT